MRVTPKGGAESDESARVYGGIGRTDFMEGDSKLLKENIEKLSHLENRLLENLQLQQIRKSLTTIRSWDLGTKNRVMD
jgi:hypothetical protein